jgi:hypothetical protein
MGTMQIDDYRFGHLVVDGQSYERDAIILPNRVLAGWWRKEGHALHREDLGAVFEARPEVLVVGQGAYGRMRVTAEASQSLESAGIEVIAQPTEQACRTYNRLRVHRSTAAALHLTC